MIIIYTDGSSKGNPGPGGWGAIISYQKIKNEKLGITNEEHATEIGGRENHTTNNRMELTACTKSIQLLIHNSRFIIDKPITVYSDASYVVKGITEWIHGWHRNNWKTSGKKPVENKDLWMELFDAIQGKNLHWELIAGHSGIEGNERCDVIATSFADGEKINLYDGSFSKYRVSLKVNEIKN